jgi:hypothetical protein
VDRDLHGVRRRRRRALPPEPVDQPLAPDRPVGVEEQERQHRARAQPAERQRGALAHGLERPEHTELQAVPPLRHGKRAISGS